VVHFVEVELDNINPNVRALVEVELLACRLDWRNRQIVLEHAGLVEH
jgi:hypothetical protein